MLRRWVRRPDPGAVVLSATREGLAVMERGRRQRVESAGDLADLPDLDRAALRIAVGGRRSIE